MARATPLFLHLFIIFVLNIGHFAAGLKCKQGYEMQQYGISKIEKGECLSQNDKYCLVVNCTKAQGAADKKSNLTSILWLCADEQNAEKCAETYEKNGLCQCQYGGEGIDHGNEQFLVVSTPPPVPSSEKAVRCKYGMIYENKLGVAVRTICDEGYHYCFAANITKKASGQFFAVGWGCSKSDDAASCTEIEQIVKSNLNNNDLSFECRFGDRGANFANEHMMAHPLFEKSVTTTTTAMVNMAN
ncbi:hypothetical protein niasHT_002525 [Heterodera trifolii]|uniref:Effector protein n=1 Tax=Heterodera trifolii TaxID=157864 RepID=A0ABD2LW16_9BILA